MTHTNTIRVAMLARAVFPLHGFGGIERHVFHLVTHLARQQVDVTLYIQPPTTDERPDATFWPRHIISTRYDYTSPILRPNSIPGRQINYPIYSWAIGQKAAQAARRGTYDVVHAQGLCAAGYGAIRRHDRQLQQIPFIANPHGLEEYRTPDWRKRIAYAPFRQLYSYGNRVADRVIATDACTQDDLPRYLGVRKEQVVVIPSAIDVDECLAFVNAATRQQMREQWCDGASPVLLSVGRLEHNKGFHVLLGALAALQSTLPPDWRWLLVGQGSERAALEAQAHALGIAGHVQFVGRLSDAELHNLYEEVDLLVHPTLYEGSSLVTLEGMIHRKPVVASAAGGIPDKVFTGRNGVLARPGDQADLARAIRVALDAQADWPAWGEESVNIVRSTFDWPVVARQTRQEYERMLARTR